LVMYIHHTVTSEKYGKFIGKLSNYLESERGVCCTKLVHRKVIPLQAWTGPEGSRSLRLPDFKTVGT
jgi:hypothetical protein